MAGARHELARLRDELTEVIGERVNELSSQEEGSPEAIARLLGEVRAAREISRALFGTEAKLRRAEADKARLQPAPGSDASPDERNRTSERVDELTSRIERLQKRRLDLTENLSALARALRG